MRPLDVSEAEEFLMDGDPEEQIDAPQNDEDDQITGQMSLADILSGWENQEEEIVDVEAEELPEDEGEEIEESEAEELSEDEGEEIEESDAEELRRTKEKKSRRLKRRNFRRMKEKRSRSLTQKNFGG